MGGFSLPFWWGTFSFGQEVWLGCSLWHLLGVQLRSPCPAAKAALLDPESEQQQSLTPRPITLSNQTSASTSPLLAGPPLATAPRPTTARPHSHAPLGRPALECRSWGRISLQALNMSHVSRRKRGRQREVWQVCFKTLSKAMTGCLCLCLENESERVCVCVCVCVSVWLCMTDSQIKGLKGWD